MRVTRGSIFDANMGGKWVNIGCNSTNLVPTVVVALIFEIVPYFGTSIYPMAFGMESLDNSCEFAISFRSCALRASAPGVVTALRDFEYPAHHPDRVLIAASIDT